MSLKAEKVLGAGQGAGLAAVFRQKSEAVKNEIDRALLRGALQVERDAKRLCPVDTGRLRASITHRLVNTGTKEVEAHVGTNVEYAPYVEFGGVDEDTEAANLYQHLAGGRRYKMRRAKPFLYPAYRMNKDKIIQWVNEAIQKTLGGR